jgi:hypothetical protein
VQKAKINKLEVLETKKAKTKKLEVFKAKKKKKKSGRCSRPRRLQNMSHQPLDVVTSTDLVGFPLVGISNHG